jgi:hypothetical protein
MESEKRIAMKRLPMLFGSDRGSTLKIAQWWHCQQTILGRHQIDALKALKFPIE